MRQMNAGKATMAVAMVALFFLGCGYHVTGGGSLPNGINRLCVAVPGNRSSDVRLSPLVANFVVSEAIAAGTEAAVGCVGEAGLLVGDINSVSTTTITRNSSGDGIEERVIITASFRLSDGEGSVIWRRETVTGTEEYSVTPGGDSTASRRLALEEAAEDLAENVWVGLTQQF